MPKIRLPNLSLLQLVLLGFMLVILPLGLLVYQASDTYRELSAQAGLSAREAVAFTRRAQTLSNLALDMERTTRQYQVMQTPALLELLNNQQQSFARLLQQEFILFPPLSAKEEMKALLMWMDTLPTQQSEPFEQLAALTSQLEVQTREAVDQHLGEFEQKVEILQKQLVGQLLLLTSLSLALILFFTWRLLRPIGYLERRIASLASLRPPSHFKKLRSGPSELIKLDQRLNWLEQQLHEIENQKQQFLRHISHELKTPLASIREAADLLHEQLLGDLNEDQQEVTELLEQNSRALQKLIEQLLSYNQLKQNKPVRFEKVALDPLLDEVLSSYQLQLQQRQQPIQRINTQLELETEPDLTRKVIDNLISNAIHYGDPQVAITIRAGCEHQQQWIEVENAGQKIPEQERQHLFEAFFQGSSRRRGSIKGSGIGLSIAADCMKSLNGKLELKYSKDGVNCFRLSWPLPDQLNPRNQ
ncbi:two-component system, NtrC family, sensor histidine kinase GlrK [Marinospirillum celere]|uniref:histidine kinase n=1 Tax=Marinospirillum celere TaxID=1122252 RepID=A0A1I1IQQ9_9GAMM|nr:HAMP domain-containing sensor histidine kinase [Marinospirillum celere]SFC38565.1 two-component system, NtrC family, sensor histidine kinase GlrK [Marinospirillum celere]